MLGCVWCVVGWGTWLLLFELFIVSKREKSKVQINSEFLVHALKKQVTFSNQKTINSVLESLKSCNSNKHALSTTKLRP